MNRLLLAAGLCLLTVASAVRAQTAPAAERMLNLSSRSRIVGGQSDLVAGFVIGGAQPKTVLLRGAGPALAGLGVGDALAAPRLRLYDAQGRALREVIGWGGDITYAGTFTRVGAFPFAVGSADCALITTLAPGTYTLQISANAGAGSVVAEIYDAGDAESAEPPRLINISSRGTVDAGGALTGGFVIGGTASKRVLVRGVGPALAAFRIAGVLADPRLRLYRATSVIAENDNWGAVPAEATAIAAAGGRSGAFPLESGSRDAALIVTLAPGAYTTQVTSADSTSNGLALVEIYEVP